MKDYQREDDMKKLQLNFKNNLISVLEYIASSEKSQFYQSQIPFMILGEELYEQWHSISYVRDKEWFQSIFNESEKRAIWDFDKIFNEFYQLGNDNVIRDTNMLLMNKDWKIIQSKAQDVLRVVLQS
ncbi:hypothetical protein [Taibaiella koreensis]|uniref:hypothetical protein n=1 Tax=Taibaiella koreensis TaxID=1268548 RepID=UPI000E59D192|nr:hypothetical protein [Taibaiella koreensis]